MVARHLLRSELLIFFFRWHLINSLVGLVRFKRNKCSYFMTILLELSDKEPTFSFDTMDVLIIKL